MNLGLTDSTQRLTNSLHEAVRQELLQRISNGTYQPGDPIPSTSALQKEFAVSPITIKRALRDLQILGLVTSIAGKGTFVRDQKRHTLDLSARTTAFADATMRLLSITREKITDPSLKAFDPPSIAMFCVRKTIFFGDQTPLMHDATYLSADVSDEIVDDFGEHLVATALERHSIKVKKISHIIESVPATGQAAQIFAIPDGYPMLRRLYKIETSRRGLTVFGIVQSPFDRVAFSIST